MYMQISGDVYIYICSAAAQSGAGGLGQRGPCLARLRERLGARHREEARLGPWALRQ